MDELVIGDKTYISSKRAAAITGYAKDYIGQLCREGRVEAKLVGRSWYVYEPSIKKHRFKEEGEVQTKETLTPDLIEEVIPVSVETSDKSNEQAVSWESPRYEVEETPVIPQVTKTEEPAEVYEQPIQEEVVAPEEGPKVLERTSEVQTAWEEWFQKEPRKSPVQVEEKAVEEDVPVVMHRERVEQVARRPVFHDIRPAAPEVFIEEGRRSTAAINSVRPKPRRRKGNLVISAVLVATMLISISFAVVATGGADKMVERSVLGEFLMVLGGTSIVEK